MKKNPVTNYKPIIHDEGLFWTPLVKLYKVGGCGHFSDYLPPPALDDFLVAAHIKKKGTHAFSKIPR
jgi:hypothetical protein